MSHQGMVYLEDGKIVVQSGGEIEVQSGATLDVAGGLLEEADIALTEGNILVGGDAGQGKELDASTDTQILIGNGTTIISAAVSGDAGLANDGTLSLDLNNLTAATVDVAADSIAIIDANDSNGSKKESIADVVTGIAGTGLAASSGSLSVDLNECAAATVDVSADSIAIVDADASNATKKEAIADVVTGVAGAGLAASSGSLSVDLDELSDAAIADGDAIVFIDADDDASKQEALADLVTLLAGTGLAAASSVLSLDLNECSAATVDVAADSLAIIDADDDSTKKEAVADLVSGMAGTGLSASSGQLSLAVPKVSSLTSQALAYGAFTDNEDATGYIDFTSGTIPAGAVPLGFKAVVATGFTGDTTAVVQVGVAGDLDRFSSVTDQSVLAAATVGAGVATDACDGMNAAQTPRVTVTGSADFSSISAGSMTVTVYYIETA